MTWSYIGVQPGQLCSKSNSRRLVFRHGVPRSIKSAESNAYVHDFVRLHRVKGLPFLGPVRLTVSVYYQDKRRDLDIALLQDCLQHAGLIDNDRQVQEIHAYRFVDRLNPRTEFVVEEMEP